MTEIVESNDENNNPTLFLESVRDYLILNKGKVKQDILVEHFRPKLIEPSHGHQTRAEFKDILQFITAVKIEDGEKYIVLTKHNNHEHFQTSSLMTRKSKRFRDRHARAEQRWQRTPGSSPLASRRNISCSNDNDHPLDRSDSVNISNSSSPNIVKKVLGSCESVNTCPCGSDEELDDNISIHHISGITTTEKEWMVACTHGNLLLIRRLFKENPELLQIKDFVFGYTILHWAAKLGRLDMINFVVDHDVDILQILHIKSHGGYTALHIAAMSGNDFVIVRLIELGMNIHVRDHSGKKAKDLVKSRVAENVQRRLGRTIIIDPNTVLHSNVSNLSITQRNKANRNSSFYKPRSREHSPETSHKSHKTVQRSMSLLKTKMQSPMMDRAKSQSVSKSKMSREAKTNETIVALAETQSSMAV